MSSKFIHEKFDKNKHFAWQEGYGVFCYSKSQIDKVIKYILNQHEHHHKWTFRDEYMDMLKKAEIEYDERATKKSTLWVEKTFKSHPIIHIEHEVFQ